MLAIPPSDLPSRASLPLEEWQSARELHRERVSFWANDRVSRASLHQGHPVYDFLFTYYSFRPAHLLRWSPGADVELIGATETDLDWPVDFVKGSSGYFIPSSGFPVDRQPYLHWALRYLQATQDRPAAYNCHGLHEWAMVYRIETPRYPTVPLRLSQADISAVVESSELRCTHYDAYRFFAPDAVPLNRSALTRPTTTDFDQPGCVHVTMDLYKFAHKIAPWCPSDVMADSFLLAVAARELDMRASPYDLRAYGFEPICIETLEGRTEYINTQRHLRERAVPLRERLIEVYSGLVN